MCKGKNMEGIDVLKQLAKRAKERLSGKSVSKTNNIHYINQKNEITFKVIKNDDTFYDKVKDVLQKGSICPINELIDFSYYKTLSAEQKEKYFFDLAEKFRKQKEKILSEQETKNISQINI